MKTFDSQADLIHNSEWDILIVLDACRYDKFNEIYKEIFGDGGLLYKTVTPAPWTLGWLLEIFDGRPLENTVFISASPAINSKEIYDEKIHTFSERLKYGDRI
jgi:hypothetical protein